MTQTEHSRANRAAWSHRAYEAWQHGYGSPPEAAASIREDPEIILREYREHLGDVRGKVVANLLGSHGRRAVALAILGAEVTVVDISAENQRYALELARAAGVTIEYIVSDILEWKTESLADHFDTVLMEYGIFHYFVQLDPLVRLLEKIFAAQIMLGKLDPATLKLCEAAVNRARQAAENLLKRGMFRDGGNWSLTVSELLDTARWLSHGQMISWEDARDPQIGLVVKYCPYHSDEWQDYWRLYCLQRLAVGDMQKLYESEYTFLLLGSAGTK